MLTPRFAALQHPTGFIPLAYTLRGLRRSGETSMQDNDVSQSAAAPRDPMAADAIPKHTTPTWESELLLSGATVFGLLQLPASIYALFDRLQHQLPSSWDGVRLIASIFSLSVVYGLIITFLLHLASRAYWVALVGLRSVYPNGIRWERAETGPIGKRIQQALFSDQDALIERADNLSTLVFSTGIGIVFTALLAVFTSIPVLLVGMALQAWVWPLPDQSTWFLVLAALIVVPTILPRVLDRMIGGRLAPDGATARFLTAIQRGRSSFGPWRMVTALTLNLTTNMRRRFGFVVFILLIYVLFFGVSTIEVLRRGHAYASLLGQTAAGAPDRQFSDYYENAGTPSQLLPHIQADILTDPYLRLWVPLDPRRSNAFNRACGKLRVPRPAPTTATDPQHALTACFGNLFAPRLDGHPLSGLVWHPYRDDALGVDGLRTYIAAQALTTGEHELVITSPATDERDSDTGRSWTIPFWR
jgi:hypothetical protein